MDTFGQKMKQALESRALRLEDVAQATGVGIQHLQALERDEYDALPDDPSVRDCLQAFAEFIDVDAGAVVADYLRERESRRPAPPSDAETVDAVICDLERAVVQEMPSIVHESREDGEPKRDWTLVPAVLVLAVVVTLTATWWWIRSASPGDVPLASQGSRTDVPAATEPLPPGSKLERTTVEATSPSARVDPARVEQEAPPVIVRESPDGPAQPPRAIEQRPKDGSAPASVRLAIQEHGIGSGIVGRKLVGQGERFAEGTQVWFWTHVTGGRPGQTLRHVWLHEGQEAISVPLTLGGPRWRTQSRKNLRQGSVGDWTVEARDDTGRVLAQQKFRCVPSSAD